MATVTLEIDRSKLPPHTDEEFEAWVMFCVGARGGIEMSNPLSDLDMEATVTQID